MSPGRETRERCKKERLSLPAESARFPPTRRANLRTQTAEGRTQALSKRPVAQAGVEPEAPAIAPKTRACVVFSLPSDWGEQAEAAAARQPVSARQSEWMDVIYQNISQPQSRFAVSALARGRQLRMLTSSNGPHQHPLRTSPHALSSLLYGRV